MKRIATESLSKLTASELEKLSYYNDFLCCTFFSIYNYYVDENTAERDDEAFSECFKYKDEIEKSRPLIMSFSFEEIILKNDVKLFTDIATNHPQLTGLLLVSASIGGNLEMLTVLIEKKLYKNIRPKNHLYHDYDFQFSIQAAAALDNYTAFEYLMQNSPTEYYWRDEEDDGGNGPFANCSFIPHIFYIFTYYNYAPNTEFLTYYNSIGLNFIEAGDYHTAFHILKLDARDEAKELKEINDSSFNKFVSYAENALKLCRVTSLECFYPSIESKALFANIYKMQLETLLCLIMLDIPGDLFNLFLQFIMYSSLENNNILVEWAASTTTLEEIQGAQIEGVQDMSTYCQELVAYANHAASVLEQVPNRNYSFIKS